MRQLGMVQQKLLAVADRHVDRYSIVTERTIVWLVGLQIDIDERVQQRRINHLARNTASIAQGEYDDEMTFIGTHSSIHFLDRTTSRQNILNYENSLSNDQFVLSAPECEAFSFFLGVHGKDLPASELREMKSDPLGQDQSAHSRTCHDIDARVLELLRHEEAKPVHGLGVWVDDILVDVSVPMFARRVDDVGVSQNGSQGLEQRENRLHRFHGSPPRLGQRLVDLFCNQLRRPDRIAGFRRRARDWTADD